MHQYERFLLDTITDIKIPYATKLARVKSTITAILKKKASDKIIDDEFRAANPDIEMAPTEFISLDCGNEDDDTTALMEAAYINYVKIAELLIKAGANVNAKNSKGLTALMFTPITDKPDTLKLLIEAKAEINAQDKDGNTAAMHCAIANYEHSLNELIQAKADLDIQNAAGKTALMFAIYFNHPHILRALIQAKANLDLQDADGHTALINAVIEQDTQAVRELINAGANLDIQGGEDASTALMYAVCSGNTAIAGLLILAGANLETRDGDDETALDYAINNENLCMISLLLEHGAAITNPLKLIGFLQFQDQTNDHVIFCFGIIYEYMSWPDRAQEYYQKINIDNCPAVSSRLTIENTETLTEIISCHKKEAKIEDLFCMNRLVSTAQKTLTTTENENKSNTFAIYCHEQMMHAVYELLLTNNLHTQLTPEQWIFVATDALGSPHFDTPLEGVHFALKTARIAEENAKTADEKIAAKKVSLSAWGIFRQITNPEHGMLDGKADHQEQLKYLKKATAKNSLGIISDYLTDPLTKENIEENIGYIFNFSR